MKHSLTKQEFDKLIEEGCYEVMNASEWNMSLLTKSVTQENIQDFKKVSVWEEDVMGLTQNNYYIRQSDELLKAQGHKYFKREPKAGGGYKYYYTREQYKKEKGGKEESKEKFKPGDTVIKNGLELNIRNKYVDVDGKTKYNLEGKDGSITATGVTEDKLSKKEKGGKKEEMSEAQKRFIGDVTSDKTNLKEMAEGKEKKDPSKNEENDRDRTKIKSKLFFVGNTYKNNEGELKSVELEPFKSNIVDKIFVRPNSVVFYRNNEPIDEIKNISMDSNIELATLIEDRLNDLA